jgi:hypothetical protein
MFFCSIALFMILFRGHPPEKPALLKRGRVCCERL